MEIATEMSRLVLEVRDGAKGGQPKHRIELLAEQFLRVTGQSGKLVSVAPIQNANRVPYRVTLTM